MSKLTGRMIVIAGGARGQDLEETKDLESLGGRTGAPMDSAFRTSDESEWITDVDPPIDSDFLGRCGRRMISEAMTVATGGA